ncbi:S9 family peptidase [Bacillus sp. AGMB 02131]|uniref:S9 family peptidase n=1 Tax=Peribacillus faecalis TaxID=2772559 RepID=A0A927CZI2_9BACI|nr:prolyl oligopeptidase family serine peptidase [Peribacillus faecalis]MBD3110537.1 S9 family peptidase [Peribacillus faecalis]
MTQIDGTIVSIQPFPSPNPSVRLSTVTYISSGLRVKGLLAEPDGNEPMDGFVYLRGGINNVGKVRPGRIIQFAAEGMIVFAPYYRGNLGGEGFEDFAGDDRNDAIAAVKVLEQLKRVNKIHVFGFSRGGIMALWTAVSVSGICSLVIWAGVSDMVLTYEERVDMRRMMKRVIGGTPSKYPELYNKRTPDEELKKLECPILIIHGERDSNVSIEQAKLLQSRLKKYGKKMETWYFADFTHFFPPQENRDTVKKLVNWMKAHSQS